MTMDSPAIKIMQDVITRWKSERRFPVENKQVFSYKSPITVGEYVLRFSNSINSFFCDKQKIEITLTSRTFHTATLSDKPLSDNPNGDKYRLQKFLEEFDNDFHMEIEQVLNDCIDTLTTSDPLF
jgi:hypothetical protein